LAAIRNPRYTKPEEITSAADSKPSETVATEWAARPTPVLSDASTALAAIPAKATRAAVRSTEGIHFEVTSEVMPGYN